MLMNWKEDRDNYILAPELWEEYPDQLRPVLLKLAVNRQGLPFLIPVAVESPDGKQNSWHISLRDAVSRGETTWIRMSANMGNGSYDLCVAQGNLPDPVWPEQDMQTLVEIAFKHHAITDADHPFLKGLRGE